MCCDDNWSGDDMWSPLLVRVFSISSIKHFVIRLVEKSFIPLLCILASSSFPWSSTKLTFVKSTSSATSPHGHVCQHLSNSSTERPASLPSRKSLVVDDSSCAVILITMTIGPPCNYLSTDYTDELITLWMVFCGFLRPNGFWCTINS